jgi:hypothetical protein
MSHRPVDIGKQQQLNDKSDSHKNGAKMMAIAHLVTLMALAMILAPLAPRQFDARFRLVNAPISCRQWQTTAVEPWSDEHGTGTKTTATTHLPL